MEGPEMRTVELGGVEFEFDPAFVDDWTTARMIVRADQGSLADVVALIDRVMGGRADEVAAALADERGVTTMEAMKGAFAQVMEAMRAKN